MQHVEPFRIATPSIPNSSFIIHHLLGADPSSTRGSRPHPHTCARKDDHLYLGVKPFYLLLDP